MTIFTCSPTVTWEDTCCSNSDFQCSSILGPAFSFLAHHVIRVLESSGGERSGEVWGAVWTQTRARAVLVSWVQEHPFPGVGWIAQQLHGARVLQVDQSYNNKQKMST